MPASDVLANLFFGCERTANRDFWLKAVSAALFRLQPLASFCPVRTPKLTAPFPASPEMPEWQILKAHSAKSRC